MGNVPVLTKDNHCVCTAFASAQEKHEIKVTNVQQSLHNDCPRKRPIHIYTSGPEAKGLTGAPNSFAEGEGVAALAGLQLITLPA